MKNATKAMKMELAAALGYLPEIRVPRWKKLINWMLYRVAGRVLRVPMDRPGSQGEAYPAPRSGQPYRLSEDPKRRIEQVKLCHESDKLKARMTADIERVVNQSQAESQAFWQKYDQARCDDQEMADPSGVVRPTIQTSGSNLPANTLTVAEQAVLVQTLGSGEHRPFRLPDCFHDSSAKAEYGRLVAEDHPLDPPDGGPGVLPSRGEAPLVDPAILSKLGRAIDVARAVAGIKLSGVPGSEGMICKATEITMSGTSVVGVSGTVVPAHTIHDQSDPMSGVRIRALGENSPL